MYSQHTKTLLNFWNDKFSDEDFETLLTCVDKSVGNQKFGKNKFLLIKFTDQRKATQLMMTIKNIIGLVHCQQLSDTIDIGNYRTKLFVSPLLNEHSFQTILQICSSEYTQLTHTNANIICSSNLNIKIPPEILDKAIVIDML